MNLNNIVEFGPVALLGLLISIISDIYSSGIKISEFDYKKYCNENIIRVSLSILCVIAGLLFSEEYFGVKISNEYAFMAGLANDKIIEVFIHRKNKQK